MPVLLDLLLTPATGRRPIGTAVTLEPEGVLTREGDEADSVYVLIVGSLAITHRAGGEEVLVATISERGALVGEIAPLGGGRRTATVTATSSCSLLRLTTGEFDALMGDHPTLAAEISATAVRRADEGELAAMFTQHFAIDDRVVVTWACGSARWHRLDAGETLFREGDEPDGVFFVVRGRVGVWRRSEAEKESRIGEVGRGGVFGETSLLDGRPRNATVIAERPTVLAHFPGNLFLDLIDRHPRLMLEMGRPMLRRAQGPPARPAPGRIIGVAMCSPFPGAGFLEPLVDALSELTDIETLSRERVEALLETPGATDAEAGSLGDGRVARLLGQAEVTSEHLLLDVGSRPTVWAERVAALSDRLLLVVPSDLDDPGHSDLMARVGGRTATQHRTAVVVHRNGDSAPTGTSDLMDLLEADDVIHIRLGSTADIQRLARVVTGRGVGLVLGGGGARGFAHLGVYRALVELGIPVDVVGGTSMGTPLGVSMADEMTPATQVALVSSRFANVLDYTIPVVSLVKGERIARSAEASFGTRDIEDLWRGFFCMSTNLTTAQPHVHRRGSIAHAIRASSAIPGVMPPVPHGDHLLVDGGVLNNLPVDVMTEFVPLGQIVAVDVAPVRGPLARADYGLSVSGWQALRSSVGRGKNAYPGITAVMMRSMIAASQRQRADQADLADCYLDLDLRGVSMFDFDDVAAVEKRGYEAAMPRLEAWLAAPTEPNA